MNSNNAFNRKESCISSSGFRLGMLTTFRKKALDNRRCLKTIPLLLLLVLIHIHFPGVLRYPCRFNQLPVKLSAVFSPVTAFAADSNIENKPSHTIPNVPYIQQSHPNTCGAAALAMLLQYHGLKITEETIIETYPGIKQTGFYIPLLWEYSEKLGLKTAHGTGNTEIIKKWILQDTPVIVYQYSYLASGSFGRQHFRIVTGYNDNSKYFTVWDPTPQVGKGHKINYSDFEKLWSLPYYRSPNESRSHFYFVIKRKTSG